MRYTRFVNNGWVDAFKEGEMTLFELLEDSVAGSYYTEKEMKEMVKEKNISVITIYITPTTKEDI